MGIVELQESAVWELAEQELAEGEDWPVLMKQEWEPTESAVCVKQTSSGYILAASCDQIDSIRFFFSREQQAIMTLADEFTHEMKANGNPLSGAVVIPTGVGRLD